ncbi:MAG: SDR family oxidoreductase [Myxococcota bacterium]
MDLQGRSALVTGATSGIGRAIAQNLVNTGLHVYAVGRDARRLAEVAALAPDRVIPLSANLEDLSSIEDLAQRVGALDVLVHAAGVAEVGPFKTAPIAALDRMHAVNVRAPFRLTQLLLPKLEASKGQVVLINSGAGKTARPGWMQYAMSKFALTAFGDALREELKASGVRVIAVFPGRTASPMQAEVHAAEGKSYDPSRFVQPEDLAILIHDAIAMPRTAIVHEIVVRHPE